MTQIETCIQMLQAQVAELNKKMDDSSSNDEHIQLYCRQLGVRDALAILYSVSGFKEESLENTLKSPKPNPYIGGPDTTTRTYKE